MTTVATPRLLAASTAVVAGVAALVVAASLAQRLGGAGGYVTDPVGTVPIAAAAVVASLARTRLAAHGDLRSARLALALVVATLVLLGSGVLAVAAVAAGIVPASVLVALWSVAWIPPLALAQLLASSVIRSGVRTSRLHVVVAITSAAGIAAGMALWQPSDPFAGVAPIAPEAWPTRMTGVGDVVAAAAWLALLLLPASLARAAARSTGRARARLATAAAGTAGAPVVIVLCVLLAVARDPGAVDPASGSVAFQVAVAVGIAFPATCATLLAGDRDERALVPVLRAVALSIAVLLLAAVGTLVVAGGGSPTVAALVVAAVAVASTAAAWVGAGRIGAALLAAPPGGPAGPLADAPAATPPVVEAIDADEAVVRPRTPVVPGLTPREHEVLALLADGASNAGIAAQLVVSERTIDAHLRAIFAKLALEVDAGSNRRVQAARRWLEGRPSTR